MPIRLNLLAEQQAAEDARRRDPVKRALWAGGAIVGATILWAVMLQFRLASAKAELTRYEAKLQAVEEDSKETRLGWATSGQIESRISNLQRYSTNRFFSATVLDALQQLKVDDIRVMQLLTSHSYSTNSDSSYKTNLVIPISSRSVWQFWKSGEPRTDVMGVISNQIAAITNKIDALKAPVDLITKIEVTTNKQEALAKIEITKPTTALEQIVLTIKARDYSNPPGKRVDEFLKALASHPYFASHLRPGEGEGIRLRERSFQPEMDALDATGQARAFIPFVIECRYRGTYRANE